MSNMNFLKGMGAGIIVGACLGMTVSGGKKSGRNRLGKAMKAMGAIVDDIGDAMGL